MFAWIVRKLWGDLSPEEMKKFGMLSVICMFILGTYWLMRPFKDSLFAKIVGATYIPRAKILSFVVVAIAILVYSKLVDMYKKHQLFYIICGFYGTLFAAVAYMLMHPTIGTANTVAAPDRLLGWIIYLGVESFGSLTVPLFWSFVNSSTDATSAKKGFGLIIAGTQIGTIAGPTLATYAVELGMSFLVTVASIGILAVPVLVFIFTKIFPSSAVDAGSDKKRTGFAEGLKLLFSRPYLMGILGVATLYEIIGTIMDFQLKFAASATYDTAEKMTVFLARFGQCTNTIALIFAFVGTSYFIRRFGLTFCLVMFPTCVAAVILYVWSASSLWVLFGAMVAIKSLSYALNNPCKEIMYLPTSKDIKFKAKGWIDGFGGRSAKATGGAISDSFGGVMANLIFYGSVISLGIVGFWILVALYVGRTNKKLTDSGQILS
jgi:AAA family ATP:ADP antiporter